MYQLPNYKKMKTTITSKIKWVLFAIFLAPIIILSMWTHTAYKVWYRRHQTLKRLMRPVSKEEYERECGKRDGHNADSKGK
jgi:hypothetical protein